MSDWSINRHRLFEVDVQVADDSDENSCRHLTGAELVAKRPALGALIHDLDTEESFRLVIVSSRNLAAVTISTQEVEDERALLYKEDQRVLGRG